MFATLISQFQSCKCKFFYETVCIIEPQSTGPPEKMEHSDERLEDEKPTPSSQDGTEEDVILVEDSDGEVKKGI